MFLNLTSRIRNFTAAVVLAVALLGIGKCAYTLHQNAQAARAEAALAWSTLDSSKIVLAKTKMDRDKFKRLAALGAKTGAKPVAGVRIVVPQWDTVFLHDTVPTETQPDGTRVAVFADSSRWFQVKTHVTAPPCCAPLQGRVEVTLPADTPSVGFLRAGNRVIATVDWQGRKVETDAFFVLPKPPRLQSFVEVLGDPATVTLRGGTNLRVIGGWGLSAAVDQRFAPKERVRVGAGVRYTF